MFLCYGFRPQMYSLDLFQSEKLKVESTLLDNQAFQLNSHPEGSCLQVQLTASVCRAGDSSESLWSGLNWAAALRPAARGWVHYACVVYFLVSHVCYLPSYHISSVIPLIYLQTAIFTTQRPLITCIALTFIESITNFLFVLTNNLGLISLRTLYFIIMKLLNTSHLSKKKKKKRAARLQFKMNAIWKWKHRFHDTIWQLTRYQERGKCASQ